MTISAPQWKRGLILAPLALLLLASPFLSRSAPNELLTVVLELLRSPDRDTRGLALQQVREAVPGTEATLAFAGLLETLAPEPQIGLLQALGDRRDTSARAAVRKAADSPVESVRATALDQLAALGDSHDVMLLAQRAALGSQAERKAARRALTFLADRDVNAALIALLRSNASPALRVEVLSALAERRVINAAPEVMRSARDSDQSVRLAALRAAQAVTTAPNASDLIAVLASRTAEVEQSAAESALLALARREREACLEPVLAAWATAESTVKAALLRALAAIGGATALQTVTATSRSENAPLREEAIRLLSDWPESTARAALLEIVHASTNPSSRLVALRGLVRIAAPSDTPADFQLLRSIWPLASSVEERQLVLGALGGVANPEALALALEGLDANETAAEAALACVLIAERLQPAQSTNLRVPMQEVIARAQDPSLRERAKKVLDELENSPAH